VKSKAEQGRFSSCKKVEAALWVLHGEELDLISPSGGHQDREAVGVTELLWHQRPDRLEATGYR